MLVGIMGRKGSGKDTCADYLVKQYGFVKKSFADPLKKVCQELFLFTNEQLYGTLEQKETPDPRWFNCSPRTAMQFVGTDLFRDRLDEIMPGLKKNIFTHHFKLYYKENPNIKIVIADVRFKNEVDLIKSLGGVIIKLDRLRTNNFTRNTFNIFQSIKNIIRSLITPDHSSESELDNLHGDYDIMNDSTQQQLYNKLDVIMKLSYTNKYNFY